MAEYSINRYLRTDKPPKRNGKHPIHLRIRVKNKEAKIATGLESEKANWDTKKNEPKDKALGIQLNKKIAELEKNINRALADDQELSIQLVKEFYSGDRKIKPENASFYDYYLDFVERKRKEGIDPETVRVYMTTYHVLKEFKSEFRISDLNLSFVEEFDAYMQDVRGNQPGGRHPKHKNLRTVVLDIIKHDIPVKNPYLSFKMPSSAAKEVFLDHDELAALQNLRGKFDHASTAYKVLAMYLFACYCGLRFSDVIGLEWRHIDFENNLINMTMKKTRTDVITPLFPRARAVVLELSDGKKLLGSNKKVFSSLAEPTVNGYLKKLSVQAGIKKYITFHSSRHTFATLLVIDGVDIYKISKYLGHSSVKMTERYLKYNLSIAKESLKSIKTFD